MMINLIFLFVLTGTMSINISSVSNVDLPKCCEIGSVFQKLDVFSCNQTQDSRIVLRTKIQLQSNDTEEYECVEAVDLNLFVFKITLSDVKIVKNISDQLLPKCCPTDYSYNPDTHSCVLNQINSIFNGTFCRVGLPQCEIIYDYKLENLDGIHLGDNYIYLSQWGEKINNDRYCIDETVNYTYVLRVCKNFDFCKSVLCLHKCCPDGQSFVNGSFCKDTYVYGMDLKRFSNIVPNISDFAIIHGYKTKVYIPKTKNHIDDQGNFYSYEDKLGNQVYYPEEETYCFEHATKGGRVYGHTLFRIIPGIEYIEKKFIFNRWAMVISNVFLMITVIYYIFSRETRKVFGKTLVSFCISLFTSFVILIYCTFNPNLNRRKTIRTCKTLGFMIIYLSFSCFLWLQVMCYDIYWTFGSCKRYSSSNNKKKKDCKRFICYSLYGWGLPLVITLIISIFHFTDFLPSSVTIKMGETKCLMERSEDNYAEILFHIIPLTVIQSVNVVFFIKTVRYCLQVKGNIQKMNQSVDIQKKQNKFRARKERFGLVIKLSFTMGFFYLFEVVSSFYDFKKNVITEHVEIIWDFINCLQGFFIFLIFVCKTKFLKKCNRKVAIEKIRKISLTTNSTKTTGISVRKSSRESKRKYSKEEAQQKFG